MSPRPDRITRVNPDRVTYWAAVEEAMQGFAEACGYKGPAALRRATAFALRTRRQRAFIAREADRAHGCRPDIFTLPLGNGRASVHFTAEHPGVLVVRGYSWPIEGEPMDDWDGGGFFLDNAWVAEELKAWTTEWLAAHDDGATALSTVRRKP